MIDLESGIIATGALALALSVLLRFRSDKLADSPSFSALPGRKVFLIGLVVACISLLLYLFLPEDLFSVYFFAGAFSSLLASIFFYKPSGSASGGSEEKGAADENSKRLSAGACGLFMGGTVLAVSGFLNLLESGPDTGFVPGRWIFAALGAIIVPLIGSILGGSEHRRAFRNTLFLLYIACFLIFCIPPAMELYIFDSIPGWFGIFEKVVLAGTILLLLGTGLCLATGGRGKLPFLLASGMLLGVVSYLAVRGAMTGLPSQSLVATGMMDRMGPFWAIVNGLVTAILVRWLFLNDQFLKRSLTGRLAPFFFIGLNIWISYASAGLYGIALSALGIGVLLPLMVSLDLDHEDGKAVRGYAASGSFFAAAGVAAYILLYFL